MNDPKEMFEEITLDDQIIILLIPIGKRAESVVYDEAKKYIKD